jgi:hypothetical protein
MKLIIIIIIIIITTMFVTSINAEVQFKTNEPCITIDSNNYSHILKNKTSGYYKNPFNAKCFALSFVKDDKFFNEDDIINTEEHIKESFYYFIYGSGLEVIHVKNKNNDKYYDFLKFDKNSNKLNILAFSDKIYPSSFLSSHYEEIYFIHEIFHLQHYNFNMNIGEYYKHEVLADIASIIVVSNKYNLTKNETLSIISNMKEFRTKFLDRTIEKKSSYDTIYSVFSKDIDTINISKLISFSDIHSYLKKF